MPAYKHPGVYVSELEAPHPIERVPTSVAAFIGSAARGSMGSARHLTGWADFQRIFGGLWRDSSMSYAVSQFFTNGGGEAVIVRLANGAALARGSVIVGNISVSFCAASEGAWGNSIAIAVSKDRRRPGAFSLVVTDSADGIAPIIERFTALSLDPKAKRFVGAMLSASALIRLELVALTADPQEGVQARTCSLGGGSDGAAILDEQVRTEGFAALEAASFNLLCLPPISRIVDLSPMTHAAAAAFCRRRGAFYVADAPSAWDAAENPVIAAATGVDGLFPRSEDAAVFFPRLRAPDPLDAGKMTDFAPCGAVAGVFTRIDQQRGVWKAPAGAEASLLGVSGLSAKLNDNENGVLNPLGINCLRVFPIHGAVVWGARTLAGADQLGSEWKYIPTRRLGLLIENSIAEGIRWAALELNGEALWTRLRTDVYTFMQKLFRQGAFQGRSPREAFYVKCDAETTTQSDIDNGEANVVVGFAPLKPAEFVLISIRQMVRVPDDD